ncbi:hypothetical protein GCM10027040_26290 [Halomonas shantousis]
MNESECQQVIDKLEDAIVDARQLMERFEATGMEEEMPGDYARLHALYTQAVNEQQHYTHLLLQTEAP